MEYIAVVAILIIPFWKIFKRAGFNPFLSMIGFVPVVGLFLLVVVLALCEWPIHTKE